jgi:hypothetical protein
MPGFLGPAGVSVAMARRAAAAAVVARREVPYSAFRSPLRLSLSCLPGAPSDTGPEGGTALEEILRAHVAALRQERGPDLLSPPPSVRGRKRAASLSADAGAGAATPRGGKRSKKDAAHASVAAQLALQLCESLGEGAGGGSTAAAGEPGVAMDVIDAALTAAVQEGRDRAAAAALGPTLAELTALRGRASALGAANAAVVQASKALSGGKGPRAGSKATRGASKALTSNVS